MRLSDPFRGPEAWHSETERARGIWVECAEICVKLEIKECKAKGCG